VIGYLSLDMQVGLKKTQLTHEKFLVINDEDMYRVIEGEKAPWED